MIGELGAPFLSIFYLLSIFEHRIFFLIEQNKNAQLSKVAFSNMKPRQMNIFVRILVFILKLMKIKLSKRIMEMSYVYRLSINISKNYVSCRKRLG